LKKKVQHYCPYCGSPTILKKEGEIPRKYCNRCKTYFYENPLPVVSCIHCPDRNLLLVKRGNQPYKGKWCLPTGFAESGESIGEAALRELKEESGIQGKILSLVDVDSVKSRHYGDLTFITWEVEQTGGILSPGDDAAAVRYFPIDKLPKLAFKSNEKAIRHFIRNKVDYWAILDSFNLARMDEEHEEKKKYFLSGRLIEMIEKNADIIASKWVEDVSAKRSTSSYGQLDRVEAHERGIRVIAQFGYWLKGLYTEKDNRDFYIEMGRRRKREGFKSSEVISALSLIRKNIWEFALSQGMWNKTIDIYIALELERRMMLFFDKAAFYLSRGYELENPGEPVDTVN
jgi:ADP-ribose pyrophosphatase YjhB (NUDIX family)